MTSSTPSRAARARAPGSTTRIDDVVRITDGLHRVGNGPFTTELPGFEGERLLPGSARSSAPPRAPAPMRLARPARAARYAARVNGLTALAVTKLDVLSGMERVPVCTAYRVDGEETAEFPVDVLDRAEPVLTPMEGWGHELAAARTWDALPATARRYLEAIEAATEVSVTLASVGADREATVVRREVLA
ncbi:MAG: adenylosuccinate synthetase [Polyangiales bacterium]